MNYARNCDEDKEQDDASENSNKTDNNNDSLYQLDMLLECKEWKVEKILDELQHFLIGPNNGTKPRSAVNAVGDEDVNLNLLV